MIPSGKTILSSCVARPYPDFIPARYSAIVTTELSEDSSQSNASKSTAFSPEKEEKEACEKDPLLPFTASEIAEKLWMNPQMEVPKEIVLKVNTVQAYLKEEGFELGGVPADGNCFFHAFLESYRTQFQKIPFLDSQEDPVSYLRKRVASLYQVHGKGSEEERQKRAAKIQKDGQWITADKEGDLLAIDLCIPIRVLSIQEEDGRCGLIDLLTSTERGKETQEWKNLTSEQKPQNYVFVVDLGFHFVYAKLRKSIFRDKRKISESSSSHASVDELTKKSLISNGSKESSSLQESQTKRPKNEILPLTDLEKTQQVGDKRKTPESTVSEEASAKLIENPFKTQLIKDYEVLKKLENEWQDYRHRFATAYFRIGNEAICGEIDWSKFKKELRENLQRRIECCKIYNKDQLEMVKDEILTAWTIERLVYSKYTLTGILSLMDGKIEEAIKLFNEAIAWSSGTLPVWLFLASALYRLGKYQEVVQLVNQYHRQYPSSNDLIDRVAVIGEVPNHHIFSMYSHFSLLTDECIEQNFLQFTHPIYINTEMDYYYAKATLALNPEYKKVMTQVFYRRGIECHMGGWYLQSVINFKKAKELFQKLSCEDHYSKALFAIGEVEEAIREIKSEIQQCDNKEKKIQYLKTLIEFYIQCEKISDADNYLDQIPRTELIGLIPISVAYFRAKVKLSLPNPSFSVFKRLTHQFFTEYQKLNPVDQEKKVAPWLRRYLQLRNDLCDHYKARGEIEVVVQVHQLFIEVLRKLIRELEKTQSLKSDVEEKRDFPTWNYDRLYLGYFELLMNQYRDFIHCHHIISSESDLSSKDAELSSQLLIQYERLKSQIQAKLKSFKLPNRSFDQDETGILEAYRQVIESIEDAEQELASTNDTESSETEKSPVPDETKIKIERLIESFQELLYFNPEKKKIQELYLENLKKAQILCTTLEDDFYEGHFNLMLISLGLIIKPKLIELVACKDSIDGKMGDNFEALCKIIDTWLATLISYNEIIEHESHIVIKKRHLNCLRKYQLMCFPNIARLLLVYFNDFKITNCQRFALRAIELIKIFLDHLNALSGDERLSHSKKEGLKNLCKALNEAITQANLMNHQSKIVEVSRQLPQHPLDLVYGKDTLPYRVAFPSQLIIDSLRQLKKAKFVQDNKNLSVHILTVVYSSRAADGTKGPKKTVHLPLNPPEEFFTCDKLPGADKSFIDRVKRGNQLYKKMLDLHKKDLNLSINAEAVKTEFVALFHRHSEQIGFEWLYRQPLLTLISDLENEDKDLKSNCKIHMVAFDIGDSLDICTNCRLSALSMQSGNQGNNDFLIKLEKAFQSKGYRLPKEKDGVRLRAVTRVLAEAIRKSDKNNLHKNPTRKNVKYLKNLGIFQYIIPNVFSSGSSHNVRIPQSSPAKQKF